MISTYDCEPTLDDEQVIQFCANGFLMLERIVPEDINRMTLGFVERHSSGQPIELMEEDWFVENVIQHPIAAGAVRSLLGKDFALPNLMANHRVECPQPAQEWHTDGGTKYGPELNYLQVFYYPQDCPREMGPTELLPGSHFLHHRRNDLPRYGGIRGSYHAVAPAGSIFLTVYSIWHRRSGSEAKGVRNNLKYNYWRTTPPTRDWVIDPGFDLAMADFSIGHAQDAVTPTFRDQFRDCRDAAGLYAWLCGTYDRFHLAGGQGWPLPPHRWRGGPYGVPAGLLGD